MFNNFHERRNEPHITLSWHKTPNIPKYTAQQLGAPNTATLKKYKMIKSAINL